MCHLSATSSESLVTCDQWNSKDWTISKHMKSKLLGSRFRSLGAGPRNTNNAKYIKSSSRLKHTHNRAKS